MGLKSLLFTQTIPASRKEFIRRRAPIRGHMESLDSLFEEKIEGEHIFIERGKGKPIIFCPGLFGSLYNINEVALSLAENYRFIIPYLPIYDLPLSDCIVPTLGNYLERFINDLGLKEVIIIGSSMGGGAALHFAAKGNHALKGLILCGSSGLSTIPLQKGFFKRKEYDFVKATTREIFFNPAVPTNGMIQEVYDALQNVENVLRSIRFTKSTARHQLHDQLSNVHVPCLLIWGKQDQITPPAVGMLFKNLLPDGELHYIDQCGHLPTQEHPRQSMLLIHNFLNRIHQVKC